MRRRLFAWGYARCDPALRRQTARLRAALLADATGAVIEVGCGTGSNFEHYPPDVHVIAVDRNEHMLGSARRAAARARARIEVHLADAEALPWPDGTFDRYVSALVLCSVPDLQATVAEAWRVLRPGGEALLLEHVRARSPRLARVQRWLNPPWSAVLDGCHLDRDPAAALRARGFDVEPLFEQIYLFGLMPVVGLRARKPIGEPDSAG